MSDATTIVDGLTFPEGPRWHEGRFWFSDIYSNRVYSATEEGGDLRVEAELDGPPCGMGWLPDGRLLVIQQDGEKLMRREHDGALVIHADLSGHTRPNDMAVAPDGTAYVGCWGFNIHTGPVECAPVLRVTPDGTVTEVGEKLHFPNGSWVLNDNTLLIAESLGNRISKFDILPDGDLANRRDWATFGPIPTAVDLKKRYEEVVIASDGISKPDAEGAIWVADFTARYAVRVKPGGEIVDKVMTGEHNCYAAALGGADGRTLFLCATRANEDEMDPELRARDPQGTIQVHRVDVPVASA